jgi:hypothetical protein
MGRVGLAGVSGGTGNGRRNCSPSPMHAPGAATGDGRSSSIMPGPAQPLCSAFHANAGDEEEARTRARRAQIPPKKFPLDMPKRLTWPSA